MMRLFYLSIFILLSINCFAVGKKNRNKCREIVSQSADTIIKAKILTTESNFKTSSSKQYFWYLNGAIGSNRGGYTGKLLHLDYTALLNNNLVRSGSFKKGLRDGKWISWYENGNIKEICYYHRGTQRGKYFLYDDTALILSEGRYRHGKFHSKFSFKNIHLPGAKKMKISS